MVTCNLAGRIGNQLFQVAATIATANKYGLAYHIPDHTMNNTEWPPVFTNLTNHRYNDSLPMTIIREVQHSYQEINLPDEVISGKANAVLQGYWQSWKYAEQDTLFTPSGAKREKGYGYIMSIFGLNPMVMLYKTAAIHIRMGDYKLYPSKHPIVTKDYLAQAIEKIYNEGIRNFFVFSDELEEAVDLARSSTNLDVLIEPLFSPDTITSPFDELRIMSKFKHIIISNSSFSWWAAYAKGYRKFIVTPDESNWFGIDNKNLDVKDLIPAEWHRIKY